MIKFNKPFYIFSDIHRFFDETDITTFDSSKNTKTATSKLMKISNIDNLLLTHSCTAALEMSALLLDLQPGDEVIIPSYTFVTTANAFVLRGAVPVFIDIRPDTLNIDENLIQAAITEKTKAIIVMHYAGVGCEMDAILKVAKDNSLPVIEDSAQGIDATYKNKALGSMGVFGTLSFHFTKNIISGTGGALFINDTTYLDRAKIIWQKGTNREAFIEGAVDKYTWVDMGSSYMMNELGAALLAIQLDNLQFIHSRRRQIWDKYYTSLMPLQEQEKLRLPYVPEYCTHNAHFFYIITHSLAERKNLMDYLKKQGVQTTFHYIPLHSSLGGRKYGRSATTELPVTDKVANCIVRLPVYPDLTDTELDYVIEKIITFYKMV